jgi:hypothetical protein
MTSGRPEVLIADNKLEALSQIFDFSQVLKTCRPDIYQDNSHGNWSETVALKVNG